MTDFWGDIPYSETGLPESEIILTPKYNTQEEIYKSMIVELDQAMSRLSASDLSYGNADSCIQGKRERLEKIR